MLPMDKPLLPDARQTLFFSFFLCVLLSLSLVSHVVSRLDRGGAAKKREKKKPQCSCMSCWGVKNTSNENQSTSTIFTMNKGSRYLPCRQRRQYRPSWYLGSSSCQRTSVACRVFLGGTSGSSGVNNPPPAISLCFGEQVYTATIIPSSMTDKR